MIRVAQGATSACQGCSMCGVRAFDPSLGLGWREILSWYPVEWAMEMVVDLDVAQQELSGVGYTGSPD